MSLKDVRCSLKKLQNDIKLKFQS